VSWASVKERAFRPVLMQPKNRALAPAAERGEIFVDTIFLKCYSSRRHRKRNPSRTSPRSKLATNDHFSATEFLHNRSEGKPMQ
jgi:hypothetical protein